MIMKRLSILVSMLLFTLSAFAQQVTVNRQEIVGDIKPMNGVNNAPKGPEACDGQNTDNYEAYRAARFPYARTHDAALSENYGGSHAVDITAIFPDFSKDARNPKNYNFALTDRYFERVIKIGGSQIFFRMGQSIENHGQKHGAYPPKDFKKWAVICEHIIRHYNEGWADGFHYNVEYWEIWNEPDLDRYDWWTSPKTWGGPAELYFELYTITARHLKECFPNLKIGGPALAGYEDWGEKFLANMAENKVPMDFFSWHIYGTKPENFTSKAVRMRAMCDKYGYTQAESILNEWNYVKNWTTEYEYSVKTIPSVKGAAFVAATMSACQDAAVDKLMYYDARPYTLFNGLFDFHTQKPLPPYYSFYAWSYLSRYGKQVKVSIEGEKSEDLYATAAVSESGSMRLLLTRYNDDNNVINNKRVKINIGDDFSGEVLGYITDSGRVYTEIPLDAKAGVVEVTMEPNSVLMLVAM